MVPQGWKGDRKWLPEARTRRAVCVEKGLLRESWPLVAGCSQPSGNRREDA